MPAQVTAPGTEMVRDVMVPEPAANSAKLPLVKGTVEAVKFELALVVQLAVVVSHVPLVGVDAPLLSHHWFEAPAFRARSANSRQAPVEVNFTKLWVRFFIIIGWISEFCLSGPNWMDCARMPAAKAGNAVRNETTLPAVLRDAVFKNLNLVLCLPTLPLRFPSWHGQISRQPRLNDPDFKLYGPI
jgi:hypothetical protein